MRTLPPTFSPPLYRNARKGDGLDPRRLGTMEKRTARMENPLPRERVERHEDQPTWRKTTPRGNQEIDRADMERSTERLETLLGH
jgi:hypothetical protein